MQFRLAKSNELEMVKNFYYKLIDDMQDSPYHPMWAKDIYPSESMLKDAVFKQELYILTEENVIIGSMILNSECIDGYASVPWQINASANEVAIIHAFGVTPEKHGTGCAKIMVDEALKIAASNGIKAVRLDALKHNIPAQKFYSKAGFTHVATVNMFYEDTGWKDFLMYEYLL